jgi:hypothetical protein
MTDIKNFTLNHMSDILQAHLKATLATATPKLLKELAKGKSCTLD